MNLFKSDWVETVFEGRNKKYGAYVLRKESSKVTLLALMIGSVVFSGAISTPVIAKMLAKEKVVEEKTIDTKIIMAEILAPPPPPEEIEKPQVAKKTKTVQEVVKHTPPVIVEKETVIEEMVTVDELKDKIAGNKNIEADEEGEVVIDGTEAEVTNNIEVIDDNQIYTAVEVLPEYPGGEAEFRKFIRRNFEAPNIDRDIKGVIQVQFVVEIDGSLTDIKVLRDLGYGTAAEAIRVLKKAKKWNPGIQNGRNVRVRYILPIHISVTGR